MDSVDEAYIHFMEAVITYVRDARRKMLLIKERKKGSMK